MFIIVANTYMGAITVNYILAMTKNACDPFVSTVLPTSGLCVHFW